MNWLLLRGEVPRDRDFRECVFDNFEAHDDVWSHLFYSMLNESDSGQIWYWGGRREHQFKKNLIEKWIPSFANYRTDFIPDVIFARGAFKEYHVVFNRYPKSFKIRYGAGKRFLPCQGFVDYDLLLQDSLEQLTICKEKFPNIPSFLFIKPAPDSLFYPMDITKEYDVCFPANGAQAFKGHDFVYSTIPNDVKLLNLGNNPKNFSYPKNVTSYRVLKSQMAENINKCAIGIVASYKGTGLFGLSYDSTPRVIPEMLACGLPIVVLDEVAFWKDKYIVSGITGEVANRSNFWETVRYVIENKNKYAPRKYYEENLSLKVAANFLRDVVNNYLTTKE